MTLAYIHPTRGEVQTPETIYHERNTLLTKNAGLERRLVALRTINRMLTKRLKATARQKPGDGTAQRPPAGE